MIDNFDEIEVLTLTDEDGKEVEFEFIGTVKLDGKEYYALVPFEDNEEGAYVVLRAEDAGNGDINLVTIEDDDEYDRVADLVEDEFFSEIDYDTVLDNNSAVRYQVVGHNYVSINYGFFHFCFLQIVFKEGIFL